MMSTNIVFVSALLLLLGYAGGERASDIGYISPFATRSHVDNSKITSKDGDVLDVVKNALQVSRNFINHSKNMTTITQHEDTDADTKPVNLRDNKHVLRDIENVIVKRGEIDSSLSSALSELQPEGNPPSVPMDSAKKFHISQKLMDKMSALKLSGKNEVINLPGAVHVYGPPPKSLVGIPQAEEPLNVVATPHLTKFHSFHKLNLMPLKFNGNIRPVHLYTNKRPLELNTGRTQHLFLPFTRKQDRYRSHALSGFFKTVPAKFLGARPRLLLQSNYIQRLPVSRERLSFNKLYQNPMQEFQPQTYREETPFGRHELPARGVFESPSQGLQYAPEVSESAFIRNTRPRIVEGGAPVEKFMPGRELTLGPNEDLDLAHLNLRDGNVRTIPTNPNIPPGLISENGLSNSPGVELLNIHPQQQQQELTNHQLEETPNTIRSPDTVEPSVTRDSNTIGGEQFQQHEGELTTHPQDAIGGSLGIEGGASSSSSSSAISGEGTNSLNGGEQGTVRNIDLNFEGGEHHQHFHLRK